MPAWDLPKEIKFLFKVLEIREQNNIDYPVDLNQLKVTCMKSALLQRLLEGKEPLPEPPPKSMSYPWYSLVEDGHGYPYEVWEASSDLFGAPAVVIDQHGWKLLEKLDTHDWIVTYPITRGFYFDNPNAQFSNSKWHVYANGCRWPALKNKSSSDLLWYIEKIS